MSRPPSSSPSLGSGELEDQRDGVPVVLLPGMNCSARLWGGLDLGPAIITRGLSQPTLSGQIGQLLDELPARFSLVGLSLGAIVAMALVRAAPERVLRLGLLSTNPYPPTDDQRRSWRQQRDRLAGGATARELQTDLLPLLLSVATLEDRPDLVAATLAMADETGEADLDAQLALQATRIDERPGLSEVRCPTLVVAARYDRLCPVERHVEIAELVPGARLQVLERAAHLSPLERPVALGGLLAGWLGVPARG